MAYLGVGLLELAVAYLVSPATVGAVVVEVVVCLSVRLELTLAAGLVDTPA